MPNVETRGSLANLSPFPDIAFQFQINGDPWPSLLEAHNGTPEEYRAIGKIRYVDQGDGRGMIQYQYQDGIELENLVQTSESAYVEFNNTCAV